jgi:hypothetical protein
MQTLFRLFSILAIALAASFASAQDTPPTPDPNAPMMGGGQGGGPGQGGGGRGGRGGALARQIIAIVSEETGLSLVELTDALRDGSTLAEIITSNGGDVAATQAAIIAAITTDINARVADGSLPQARADRILENLPARVENAINGDLRIRGARRDGQRLERNIGRVVLQAITEQTNLGPLEVLRLSRDGQTLVQIITANNGNVQAVTDAAVAELTAQINEALANGTLNQEQADLLLANVEPAVTDLLNGTLPQAERPRLGIARNIVQLAAQQTGLTAQAIAEQLRGGQTLAAILTASGVSVDDFSATVLADAQQRLAERVLNGRLTQERADALYAQLQERLPTLLNTPPAPVATPSA